MCESCNLQAKLIDAVAADNARQSRFFQENPPVDDAGDDEARDDQNARLYRDLEFGL